MTWGIFRRGKSREMVDLSGVTILLVEDRQELREEISTLLRQCGAMVLEAASPGEALEFTLAGADFRILLINQDTEDEWSGRDLALYLCQRQPDLRVALLAACIDDVLLGRLRPGWRVIVKPVQQADLMAIIGNLAAS